MLELIKGIEFDASSHTYTRDGKILTSVTQLLTTLEPEFDAEKISFFVARKQVRELVGWKDGDPEPDAEHIEQVRQEVLQSWDDKRSDASEHGIGIHSIMEDAVNYHILPSDETDPNQIVRHLMNEYAERYEETKSEQIIFSDEFGVSGMTDFVGIRKTRTRILDIEDYKTNLHKGIRFDSISKKDGKIKHENKYFAEPFNYLELCNYNRYALQLSAYAYLFERFFNCRIGRLSIRWVEAKDGILQWCSFIPVPYMRSDIEKFIMEHALKNNKTLGENW